jgi:uncharacterized membrane protein
MKENIKQLVVSAFIMISLDAIYLTLFQQTFASQIVAIQGSPMKIRIVPTILCYLLLVGGLYHFVLKEKKSWIEGGILGCIIYGVYDTTTLALLKKWDPILATIDILWGTILFALTTWITYQC